MKNLIMICNKEGITLTDLAYLYARANKLENLNDMTTGDLMRLLSKDLVDDNWMVTERGKQLLTDVNKLFKPIKNKLPEQMDRTDVDTLISGYREMWPAKVLPSGKPARVPVKVLYDCFLWFFANYNYTWETVYEATQMYLTKQENDNYRICRTSQYFIVKTTEEKIKESVLADYCTLLLEGGEQEEKYFKLRVV